jgi:hypothetical protein
VIFLFRLFIATGANERSEHSARGSDRYPGLFIAFIEKPDRSSSRRNGPLPFSANHTRRRGLVSRYCPARWRTLNLLSAGRSGYPVVSLLFGTVAFQCAGCRIAPAFLSSEPRGEPWRPRSEKRYGFVQAPTGGISSFGADRAVAYKVEAH